MSLFALFDGFQCAQECRPGSKKKHQRRARFEQDGDPGPPRDPADECLPELGPDGFRHRPKAAGMSLPESLQVRSPTYHQSASGQYELFTDNLANGQRVYKTVDSSVIHYLYVGANGLWFLIPEEQLKQRGNGFDCSAGCVHHPVPHGGLAPNALPAGRWNAWDGQRWFLDPSIQITDASDGVQRCLGDDAEREVDSTLDTVIGKGFTAAMRRGVEKTPDRENITPFVLATSEEGGLQSGFVAILQQGFEGLVDQFAGSKEEVLKRKGPVPATEYESVPGDDIDQKVLYFATRLEKDIGEELMIYRISKGEYEIDGVEVRMEWQPRRTKDGRVQNQIVVIDQDKDVAIEPLHTYLRAVAGVKHELLRGTPLARLPEAARKSFDAEESQAMLRDADSDGRLDAMQRASLQARQREEHARDWAEKNPVRRMEGGTRPKSLGRPGVAPALEGTPKAGGDQLPPDRPGPHS